MAVGSKTDINYKFFKDVKKRKNTTPTCFCQFHLDKTGEKKMLCKEKEILLFMITLFRS